jgi:hypothetical protein
MMSVPIRKAAPATGGAGMTGIGTIVLSTFANSPLFYCSGLRRACSH